MSEHRKLTRDLGLLVLLGVAGILVIATQPDPADVARLVLTGLVVVAILVAVIVIAATVQALATVRRERHRRARRPGYLYRGPR